MRRRVLLASSFSFLALAACGDNNLAPPPDAGPPQPDAPAAFQPAPHEGQPQLTNVGGNVLTAPRVVPIFYGAGDPMQAEIEGFLPDLASSDFWTATTNEYGVGALTVLPSIVTTDAVPTSDAALETWLTANTDGSNAMVPKNDSTTIYIAYLPLGAGFTDVPGACVAGGWGGYHSEAQASDGSAIIYAVIPRCADGSDTGDPATVASSHEINEASTDPRPYTARAFNAMDADHWVWGRTPGAEDGDLCEYLGNAPQRIVGGTYDVQRCWSNAAAAAGHDPCVPALSTPYQGVTPVLDDAITIAGRGGGASTTTKGVQITAGTSKTIEVDLWSDGPTDDYTVNAYDVASVFGGQTAQLTFAWDKQTGKNGDKLMLTITHVAAGRSGGSEFVLFVGPDTNASSEFWGLVGN